MTKHIVNSVIPFFSGIVALIIALFHAQIRWLFYHPKLEMDIDLENRADCHQTIMRDDKGREALCYFLRLRVHNKSYIAPAQDVEIFIENIERKEADNQYRRIQSFMPMNLVWAYFENEIYYPRLSPRSYRHCGFAYIIDPTKLFMSGSEYIARKYQNKLVLNLSVYFRSTIGTHILEPGKYRLNLSVSASNAGKKSYTLELDFNGPWSDHEDMMLSGDHLGIRLV